MKNALGHLPEWSHKMVIESPITYDLGDHGQVIFFKMLEEYVPDPLRKGGGGMISKIVEAKHNARMILVEPQDDINKKYFKYIILHEKIDNSTENHISMIDIEEKVLKQYQLDMNGNLEGMNEYLQSRIDFFEGSYAMNGGDNCDKNDKTHQNQILLTITRLKSLINNN